MDTPEKNRIPINICSISKLEDSPVFNYISNLSPIEPIKSANNDHSFNSLSYSSPPPVFTSPEINQNKVSRFRFQRHHFLDSANKSLSVPPQIGNEESNVADEVINTCVKQTEVSGKCSAEPSKENSELEIKGPEVLKHDSGRPDSNQPPCNTIEMDPLQETSQMVNPNECTIGSEKDLRKLCWAEKHKEAEVGDGMTSISANLSSFSLSLNKKNSVEPDHKNMDPGAISFVSSILNLPQDNNSCQKTELTNSASSCEHVQMGVLTSQSEEHCDRKEKSVMPSLLSAIPVDSDSNARRDESGTKCTQSKQSCGISRRSLIFGGAPCKNSNFDSNGSLTVSEQQNCTDGLNKNHGVQLKIGSSNLSSVLPGIGLHLNALATSSNGKVIMCKTSASEKQLSMPNIVYPCNSSISDQNGLPKCLTSSTTEGDLDSSDSEAKMKASSPQALCCLEELEPNSPKRKRFKFENIEENGSCKRCNCKRSKCLKLYCECFAAGLYCIEPCACQDCFNKPIHENTVLETRRQIESRNPLAFAPKVINAVPESRDNSNKTPGSARHKQGCNCRKSGCLKKYCECFQGGVGCSFSCRCMGCKNTFGQRDGFDEMENEVAEEVLCKKNREDIVLKPTTDVVDNDAPKLQKETIRTSLKLPHTITGKLYISSSSSAAGSSLVLCSTSQSRENQIQVISEDEKSGNKNNSNASVSPNSNFKRSSRKLILRSIPRFPSLRHPQEQ